MLNFAQRNTRSFFFGAGVASSLALFESASPVKSENAVEARNESEFFLKEGSTEVYQFVERKSEVENCRTVFVPQAANNVKGPEGLEREPNEYITTSQGKSYSQHRTQDLHRIVSSKEESPKHAIIFQSSPDDANTLEILPAKTPEALVGAVPKVSSAALPTGFISAELPLVNSVLETIKRDIPSKAEVDAGIEVFSDLSREEMGDLYETFTSEEARETLLNIGNGPLVKQTLHRETENVLSSLKNAPVFSMLKSRYQNTWDSHMAAKVPREENSWEALLKAHECLICKDVLAAPVILTCKHNFCGGCVDSLIQSCVNVSAEPLGPPSNASSDFRSGADTERGPVAVVTACPSCREPIQQSPIFETHLDETILRAVEGLEDIDSVTGEDLTERKNHYEKRREAYVAIEQKRTREKEMKKKAFRERNLLHLESESNQGEEEGIDDDWEQQFEWAIPFMMVALFMLIVTMKGRG